MKICVYCDTYRMKWSTLECRNGCLGEGMHMVCSTCRHNRVDIIWEEQPPGSKFCLKHVFEVCPISRKIQEAMS